MKFEYEKSLTREQALEEICARWNPVRVAEWVMLDKAYGRVASNDIHSSVTLPIVRSSKMDGIGVRSADFAEGLPDTSCWKRDVDWCQADTGDDFSDDFDAVIAIENVQRDGDAVSFIEEDLQIEPGDGVNPAGSIVNEGDLVVHARTLLTPERVAACAVAGLAQVSVLKKCRVGFMATGSELIPWGSYPKRGQNIEANSLLVRGLAEQWGAECFAYPVVADDPQSLAQALDRALASCDIVLVNGGSSRGEEDFNSQMIEERSQWFSHGVRAVPGRPIGMGIIEGTPVINMPGPVLAASLCMDWLVRGMVDHFYGGRVSSKRTVSAVLGCDVKKPALFERIVRVRLEGTEDEGYTCYPLEGVTGPVANIREADGQVALPLGIDLVSAGTPLTVALFD